MTVQHFLSKALLDSAVKTPNMQLKASCMNVT